MRQTLDLQLLGRLLDSDDGIAECVDGGGWVGGHGHGVGSFWLGKGWGARSEAVRRTPHDLSVVVVHR